MRTRQTEKEGGAQADGLGLEGSREAGPDQGKLEQREMDWGCDGDGQGDRHGLERQGGVGPTRDGLGV